MDKIKTKLYLLTNHVMGDPSQAVNVIASNSIKAYDDVDDAECFNE